MSVRIFEYNLSDEDNIIVQMTSVPFSSDCGSRFITSIIIKNGDGKRIHRPKLREALKWLINESGANEADPGWGEQRKFILDTTSLRFSTYVNPIISLKKIGFEKLKGTPFLFLEVYEPFPIIKGDDA